MSKWQYNRDCACGGCRVGGKGDHVPPISAAMIAEAEARGAARREAEVATLTAEVARLTTLMDAMKASYDERIARILADYNRLVEKQKETK